MIVFQVCARAFIMFTLASELDTGLRMALILCFAAGGVLGDYMTVRGRIKKGACRQALYNGRV